MQTKIDCMNLVSLQQKLQESKNTEIIQDFGPRTHCGLCYYHASDVHTVCKELHLPPS